MIQTIKKLAVFVSKFLKTSKKSVLENGIKNIELTDKLIKLDVSNIIYAKSTGNRDTKSYTEFTTTEGVVYYKLISLKKLVDETDLIYIAKNTIINPNYIIEINNRFKKIHLKMATDKVVSFNVNNGYKKKLKISLMETSIV